MTSPVPLPAPTPTVSVTVTRTITPPPTTPTSPAKPADTSAAILIAAIIAVCGVALTGFITWLLGRRNTAAAERSARAAKRSSKAADRSSKAAEKSADAAQESVAANRETAAGVAQRAEAEALAKRYQDAAAQLGHNQATVRLAGAYTMARLADDWPDQRQSCVNVLCGYLRMPSPEAAEGSGELEVRSSIMRLIEVHVTEKTGEQIDEARSWSALDFDFSRARLHDVMLQVPNFKGKVSFTGATFTGKSLIYGPRFSNGADFSRATFSGALRIARMMLGSNLYLGDATVEANGALLVAQSWADGRAQIFLDDLTVQGAFGLFVHADDDLHVYAPKILAGANSVIVIEESRAEAAPAHWLRAFDWVFEPGSQTWLPHLGDAEEQAEIERTATEAHAQLAFGVDFGDPDNHPLASYDDF